MPWVACPLCQTRNQGGSLRCTSCGAELDDPEVRALAGEAAAVSSSSLGEAGGLSASSFLSFSLESAAAGGTARRLALAGSALLAIGFLAPLTVDFEHLVQAWRLLDGGPAFALLFPLVAMVGALALAWAPLAPRARSALLAALGLAGIATLPALGRFAGTPSAPVNPFLFAMPIAAAAIAFRLHAPRSRRARVAVVVAAALVVIAILVPVPRAEELLPAELKWFGLVRVGSGSMLDTFCGLVSGVPHMFLYPLTALVPFGLMAAAVALAWPAPKGVWDTRGKLLLAVGWLVALYLPGMYLLWGLNLLGSETGAVYVDVGEHVTTWSSYVQTTLIARAKLAVLAAAYALWVAIGGLALLAAPAVKTARSARTG